MPDPSITIDDVRALAEQVTRLEDLVRELAEILRLQPGPTS